MHPASVAEYAPAPQSAPQGPLSPPPGTPGGTAPQTHGAAPPTAPPPPSTLADVAPSPPPLPAPSTRAATGLSVLLAAASGVAGYKLTDSGYGAAAGLLYYGAARNAWRAARSPSPMEAVTSGTASLFGVAAAAYFTHKAIGAAE